MVTFLEVVRLAVVGLISGLFATALSHRGHRERKWWELKVTAYQNAIEALSDLFYCYDTRYAAAVEHRDLPKEFDDRLAAHILEAYPRLRRYADSGAFLFSDRANTALKEFLANDDSDFYIDALDNRAAKAKKCLATLIECSKSDLQLKKNWWNQWI